MFKWLFLYRQSGQRVVEKGEAKTTVSNIQPQCQYVTDKPTNGIYSTEVALNTCNANFTYSAIVYLNYFILFYLNYTKLKPYLKTDRLSILRHDPLFEAFEYCHSVEDKRQHKHPSSSEGMFNFSGCAHLKLRNSQLLSYE